MNKINWEKVKQIKDSSGQSLGDSLVKSKVLLIFLRHFGCTYCKKVVSELSDEKAKGSLKNLKPIFVHMSDVERGAEFFESYGLKGVAHISNADKSLYKEFGLVRGTLNQVIGPKVIAAGVKDLFKFGIGKIEGDSLQMQGAFILEGESVAKSFKSKTVSDTVDFSNFLEA